MVPATAPVLSPRHSARTSRTNGPGNKFDHVELATVVQAKLCVKWRLEQISLHLAQAFLERQEMRVCPETIYQALYVQGRGHLPADLHQHLRTGRAARRPRGSTANGRGRSRS